MKNIYKAGLFGLLSLSVACSDQSGGDYIDDNSLQYQFADVLDLKNSPDSAMHYGLSSFSDKGAWHSFALPSDKTEAGSFPGPFLMTQDDDFWLSNGIAQLGIGNPDSNEIFWASDAQTLESHYYPGKLWQRFTLPDIEVEMELIFISERSSLIKTTISNAGDADWEFRTAYRGQLTFTPGDGFIDEKRIIIPLKEEGLSVVNFDQGIEQRSVITEPEKTSHKVILRAVKQLQPGEQLTEYYAVSVYFDENEQAEDQPLVEEALENPDAHFAANNQRWSGYLEKFSALRFPQYQMVAVKALNTLMNNWRSPAQDLHYNGLFPSYAYRGFHGVWSWDSWKHAVALAQFDPELAKDQLRVMFDYQDDMGMVPDVIYRKKEWNNWRDTKPPLSAWAVWKIYESDRDTSFVNEMYPQLMKYHYWWYQYRDHDQNGLCEYGSTDGTRIAAAWESGMDNAVRFDDAVMLKNNENGWSLNQESVDLNAYLVAEKRYLSQMAEMLDEHETSLKLEQEADFLTELVRKSFYSQKRGFYYDKTISSAELKEVEGTEGWTPLWAGIASTTEAESVIKIMLDTAKFNTFVPLPTFTKDHPKFNPKDGYWRGPVWLDQFYFGSEALKRYGHADAAEKVLHQLITNADGLNEQGRPIYENYHPVTGEGLNARHFSWSAAHLLMMLLEE